LDTTEIDVRVHHPPTAHATEPPQIAQVIAAQMHLTLHVGTAAVPARARPLGGSIYRLRLASALPLRIGDRGLLREPSNHEILLGVTVLDPQPPALRRRGAAAQRAATLTEPAADNDDAVAVEIRRRGVVSREQLRRLGVRGELPVPLVGDWLVDGELAQSLRLRLVELVEQHGREHPLEPGLPVGAATSSLDLPDPALVAALLSPGLVVSGGRITAADSAPGLPTDLALSLEALRARLAAAPLDAPNAAELVELGLGHREIAAAVRAGVLLRLADGVVLLPDAPVRARERLTPLPQPFTVSEAKQAWQTSRRVAVPLLELLDSAGITERLADGTRRLAAAPDN
jgi:selenocysteine-specific elongation factor